MHYGSQDDIAFLDSFINRTKFFDVIIDDGGHTMSQQLTSVFKLLPIVKPGGFYVIEDLETSLGSKPANVIGYASTTLGLIKDLVDDVQKKAPQKKTPIANNVNWFEIRSNICIFSVK